MAVSRQYYPLTWPQKSIWVLEKLNPGTGIANIAATLKIDEQLDYQLMSRAVNLLIRNNSAFHLRFREMDGEPVQYLVEPPAYRLDFLDFSGESTERLYAWDTAETQVPFVLEDSELFYFALVKIDEQHSGFFARIHHLISDAWSFVQIGNETMAYYRMLQRGEPVPEGGNPSYLEFMESEQEYLNSSRFERDREFWTARFHDLPELTTLKEQVPATGYGARRKTFVLPDRLSAKIREHCSENRNSIFSLFYAALSIYLNRVRNREQVTIGVPVLNRTNAREKKTIGMFISTVPFSVPIIALSYQNGKMHKNEAEPGQEGRWHFNASQVESLYLHINDREDDGKIVLNYVYLDGLFYTREIEFVHDHVVRLLWHALDNPSRSLSELHMLSEVEMDRVVREFNRTEAEWPREATVAELFEEQVRKNPDAEALRWQDQSVTYDQLNRRANRLAARLRREGAGPDRLVALLFHRGPEMLTAVMGVVKSGAAYVPVDPEYPEERIRFMLEDSRALILLTGPGVDAPDFYSGTVIPVDVSIPLTGEPAEENPSLVNRPQDLLYIIYTSGSTGQPKGAMIEHRNVVRLLFNDRMPFDFSAQDVWTLFHSYCFDFSVWEMYGALLYGGALVLVPRETARDTLAFRKLLIRERVSVLNQTPGAFYHLVSADTRYDPLLQLRMVIFGGEALKPMLLQPFHSRYPDTRLVNMYGITETTVHVTWLDLTGDDMARPASNIGRPIPTTRVYILDRHLNPLPIGVPGEICVSGDGVCRGYLNNPELTGKRFVPSPFVPGERLYRSGDLGRFYPRGDIEYLGRIDSQVKIRGHRIELGEIESRLQLFEGIRQVVVLPGETSAGTTQLICWYVADREIPRQQLEVFLGEALPSYMIPADFIQLDGIPLNSNGKVDTRQLPDRSRTAGEGSGDETPLLKRIREIWEDVLGIEGIRPEDHFFALGGDSLSAVSVVSRLGDGFTFADLYQHPVLRQLAEVVSRKEKDSGRRDLLIRLAGHPEAPVNILCFPYGGGNGTIYRDLAEVVVDTSEEYAVWSVDLPGHNPGDSREPVGAGELARQIVQEAEQRIRGRIVLYGHCVGAALALETARLLEESGRSPEEVYLGAIVPPGNPGRLGPGHDPWKLVSDRNILGFLGRLGMASRGLESDYLENMIRMFRHDVRSFYQLFYELHRKQPGRLKTPVHCVVGQKDLMTRGGRIRYRLWNRYAERTRLTVIGNARHYFMKTNTRELADLLTGSGKRRK